LGIASGIGIPVGLVASTLFAKAKSLAWWAAGASGLTFLGYGIFTICIANRSTDLILVACTLVGFGMSTTFPISLSLISSRASTGAQTTQLSAMAQGWGYLIAAAGSFTFGLLANATGTWTLSFGLTAALIAAQIGFGFYSGLPRVISAK
jgi:CP family cyanate transporter-like MFS transporter